MVDTEQPPPGGGRGPGPGGGPNQLQSNSSTSSTTAASNHQESLTYAKALGGATGGSPNLRKYAEIVAQQKADRNVLELKLKKITKIDRDNGDIIHKPRNLSFDDISEFIFETLSIQFEDCIGVDLNTGRYDTREIIMKPGVNTDIYITKEPLIFREHEMSVTKMLNDVTKVIFKNVPMYVPDEELLHLCGVYGTVTDNKVHWETQRITTTTKKGILVSPTRYVMMNLNNGAMFNNFYWMEGPMASDPGRRITVLHHGQTQQCSNCFLTATTGCKGVGNGFACAKAGVPRAKMSAYMLALKTKTGYESLKNKYMRQLARMNPNIQEELDHLNTTQVGSMDNNILVDEDEETEISLAVLPINPIVEKDNEIAELTKTVMNLKSQVASIPILEKNLEEAKADKKRALSITRQVGRRLSVSRKANEQKMVSLIRTGRNWSEDSAHLACSHAATLNDEEFELDESEDIVKPKNPKYDFMNKVEEHIDNTDKMQQERLEEMKKLILEQMKPTIKRRGEKRGSDEDQENASSKQRVNSPPKL